MSVHPVRRTWPARPAPARLGYPKPADQLRLLAVVRPARGEKSLADPWSAVWMDRGEPGSFGQVAGSTFTETGTRCASFEPEAHAYPNGERSHHGRALTDRQRRLRVAWADVPKAVRKAVLAAVAEWDASEQVQACPACSNGFPLELAACPACGRVR